jgi:hypothetical protein
VNLRVVRCSDDNWKKLAQNCVFEICNVVHSSYTSRESSPSLLLLLSLSYVVRYNLHTCRFVRHRISLCFESKSSKFMECEIALNTTVMSFERRCSVIYLCYNLAVHKRVLKHSILYHLCICTGINARTYINSCSPRHLNTNETLFSFAVTMSLFETRMYCHVLGDYRRVLD